MPPKCCKLLQRRYAYAGVSVTKISVNQYNYMQLNTRMHGAWPMLIKTLWYQPSHVAAVMAHCCSDNDVSVILVARLNYPSFEATPHTNIPDLINTTRQHTCAAMLYQCNNCQCGGPHNWCKLPVYIQPPYTYIPSKTFYEYTLL